MSTLANNPAESRSHGKIADLGFNKLLDSIFKIGRPVSAETVNLVEQGDWTGLMRQSTNLQALLDPLLYSLLHPTRDNLHDHLLLFGLYSRQFALKSAFLLGGQAEIAIDET